MQNPKILLIGPTGQVGWELYRTLQPLGEVVVAGRAEKNLPLDLTKKESILSVIRQVQPSLVVNAAAYTAVDKAEEEESLVMFVNGEAPGIIAQECKKQGAHLVHYSTDYVFDGKQSTPYREEDRVNPISVYGKSKLAGEKAILAANPSFLIFRTCWVYGSRGKNFLLTILRLARERDQLKIVNDQLGSPTWCRMIAETTTQVLAKILPSFADYSGIYNLSCEEQTSWDSFAKSIVSLSNEKNPPEILPIPTVEYPTPATRPMFSVLSNRKLRETFGIGMPSWKTALELCMAER